MAIGRAAMVHIVLALEMKPDTIVRLGRAELWGWLPACTSLFVIHEHTCQCYRFTVAPASARIDNKALAWLQ
jgi:hypothetical protein